jgi:hypothetical protein
MPVELVVVHPSTEWLVWVWVWVWVRAAMVLKVLASP